MGLSSQTKGLISKLLFDPAILIRIHPESYVRGTIGGSAETNREFERGLRKERKLLSNIKLSVNTNKFNNKGE